MPHRTVYLTETDVDLLEVLKAEGVKTSRLIQDAIRQEAERRGYTWEPAQMIIQRARITKKGQGKATLREVG